MQPRRVSHILATRIVWLLKYAVNGHACLHTPKEIVSVEERQIVCHCIEGGAAYTDVFRIVIA